MKDQPFFISTAIPYVNAAPHIGFALEYIQADAQARYQRLRGADVFFVTGTDENSLKNVQAAEKVGEEVSAFVDKHAAEFQSLKELLNCSDDNFIRTTEERHIKGAQKLWSTFKKEDVYKKSYEGLYCVGCEAFYTEDDLIEGLCPDHKKAPEKIEEENYFFRLSNYQDQIKDLIEKDVVRVFPEKRKNEILAFIDRGLHDFSISRSQERARGWGVVVPEDDTQIMYVWVDALSNYINALGYADDRAEYQKYWKQTDQESRNVTHVIGKGVTRFHAIYWIGMLLSAEQPLPSDIFAHGYITVEGQKMSKSIGNVLNPHDLREVYSADALRYFCLGKLSAYEDSDFSIERFETMYTADLVNGVGNLTSRIISMVEKYNEGQLKSETNDDIFDVKRFWKTYDELMQAYRFDHASDAIQELVKKADEFISNEKPWEKVKQGESIDELLYGLAELLRHVAVALLPFVPESAEKILIQLGIDQEKYSYEELQSWGLLKKGDIIKKGDILFQRLSS